MSVYVWIAGTGILGLIGLILFLSTVFNDQKVRKKLGYSIWSLLPNWLFFILAGVAMSMMVYFFLNVKEQLIQFGS